MIWLSLSLSLAHECWVSFQNWILVCCWIKEKDRIEKQRKRVKNKNKHFVETKVNVLGFAVFLSVLV